MRQSFRDWLAERLLSSRYATASVADDQIDGIAKRLGVDPELLLEVRARKRLERYEQGLPVPIGNRQVTRQTKENPYKNAVPRLYQYRLWMPPEIKKLWDEECSFRGMHGPTLLRTLLHFYLLGSREPVLEPAWRWNGKLLKQHRPIDGQERATIPNGAKRALMARAGRRNVTAAIIVRTLVLEALRGEHRRLPPMQAAMMFDDETRYNLGDSKRT